MPFYGRALRYLTRKRAKSVLLLLILLLVNSMILCANLILRATERTRRSMEEKAGVKVVCETKEEGRLITQEEIDRIQSLPSVTRVNRMGSQTAYLSGLSPVTASESREPDNQQVSVWSFDDQEKDGPFAAQSCRLTQGRLIGAEDPRGALINEVFAQANGLSIGDTITLETEEGRRAKVEVIGEYLSGSENRQGEGVFSVFRVENQIYMGSEAWMELFGDEGYYKISVYTGQPELLGELAEKAEEILGDKAEIAASDVLYRQMEAPLTQIARVVGLMRILTFLTGTLILSLLLCMWMRTRQREMGVLLSMGEPKSGIVFQALSETAVLFLLALFGACFLGTMAADRLQGMLLSAMSSGISLEISLAPSDLLLLLGTGSAAPAAGVVLSLLPVLRTNPKDILSRMEG